MLNYLDSRNLSKIWWISAVTIIIGALLGTDSTLPGVLPYFAFIFFGGISLYLQYGRGILAAILEKPKKGSWKLVIPVLIISYVIAFIFLGIGNLLGNQPVTNGATGSGPVATQLIRLFWICISLIGEEIITAALTLPFVSLLMKRVNKRQAWIYGAIICSLLFGMLHFRAYDWNLYQMLVPIGLGRLPFTWLWVKSDSLWPAVITHILYDVLIFLPAILFGI